MIRSLQGKVALVTGATRGIGKGIALQLADAGALVYVTGRTLKSKDALGSLEITEKEIRDRGGVCVPVQVDHEKDDEIERLFEKIAKEQNGRLDLLVNNAYKGVETIFGNSSKKFWQQPSETWDNINNVGLRNHFICSINAARLMVPRKQGLIVNITSLGGTIYLFNVPYGIGKAAVDRMVVDCGIELRKSNVAFVGLMVGATRTETIASLHDSSEKMKSSDRGKEMKKMFDEGCSIEFPGKCVVSLLNEKRLIKYSSKVLIAEDYAQSKGIRDVDGRKVPSFRQLNTLGGFMGMKLPSAALKLPDFVKVPKPLLAAMTSKFY